MGCVRVFVVEGAEAGLPWHAGLCVSGGALTGSVTWNVRHVAPNRLISGIIPRCRCVILVGVVGIDSFKRKQLN